MMNYCILVVAPLLGLFYTIRLYNPAWILSNSTTKNTSQNIQNGKDMTLKSVFVGIKIRKYKDKTKKKKLFHYNFNKHNIVCRKHWMNFEEDTNY